MSVMDFIGAKDEELNVSLIAMPVSLNDFVASVMTCNTQCTCYNIVLTCNIFT